MKIQFNEALDFLGGSSDFLFNDARDYIVQVVRKPYSYIWIHHVYRKEGDQWKSFSVYPYYATGTKGKDGTAVMVPLVEDIEVIDGITLKFKTILVNHEEFNITPQPERKYRCQV